MNYHQKDPRKMKIRVPINMETGTLEDIDDISKAIEMPRSKVTRAMLRYAIEHIKTSEIYNYSKE